MSIRRILGIGLLVAGTGLPAHAQYYPGWGGWAAPTTVAGSTAMGMGNFAAGAGAYNVQTAQARSINAQTNMEVNEYLYQSQQRRNRNYQAKLAREKDLVNATAETNYKRIHDDPNSHDLNSGDAANVVYDELVDPKVFGQALQAGAKMAVPSSLVKALPLSYAPQALTISLEELQVGGAPDALQTNPAFDKERTRLREIAKQVRAQSDSEGQIDPSLLVEARTLIQAALKKVATVFPEGSKDRKDSENFLKGVYGVTKMLQKPNIKAYLKDLEKIETTDMAHLLSFMHTYSLRFGAADGPEQEAAQQAIYPALVQLRNTVIPGGNGSSPFTEREAQASPKALSSLFSGIDPGAIEAQQQQQPGGRGQAAPPPPPAGREGAQSKGARLKGALQKKAARPQ